MSRTATIVLLLIGVLLFLGSCAPFAYVLYHEAIVSPVESQSLSAAGSSDTATFQAKPGTLARFTLEADISTSSVQEDPDSFNEEYLSRFRFPVRYRISDADGNVLLRKKTTLAWKDGGSISKSNANTSSTGGTLRASTNMKKFTVPADGNINIDIELGPDTTYEASYSSPQLHLYAGMINNIPYIVAGVVMLFLGFVLSLIGFIFLVIRSAQAGIEQNPDRETISENHNINQEAMIIQLSALSDYLIPFGSLIVPVVLWLVWREKDPYLDEMGREAVNFQLTMLVYYCISLVLCLVLIGFLLLFAVMIFHLAYIIIGAIQTSRGSNFRYPLTIRFFR